VQCGTTNLEGVTDIPRHPRLIPIGEIPRRHPDIAAEHREAGK